MLSQAEIARTTGLSPASVSNIVRRLEDLGIVSIQTGVRGGRRAREVRLRPDRGMVLGIDFGHQHVRVALADLDHAIAAEQREACEVATESTMALTTAKRLTGEVLAMAGRDASEVRMAGVGIPAPLPGAGPRPRWPILPDWEALDPASAVSERLGVRVVVDNDANVGARGEMVFGAGRGASNLVYIKASTGLGAGLVVDGRVYRGSAGSAGEIGHLTIDQRGPICRCGNRGCLETLVGGPYLLELVRHSHPELRTVEELVALAVAGDGGCSRVIEDAARQIGFVAANLCTVVNPELVVVGGDLAAAGDILLEPLRSALARYSVISVAKTPVVAARTGERAEMLGALVLATEEIDVLDGFDDLDALGSTDADLTAVT